MRRTPADILAAHRTVIAATLVDSRGTIDHVYHELGDQQLIDLYDVVLGKLSHYVAERDAEALRSYLRRWVVVRVGAGARHENLIPALVGIGDAIIEVAQEREGDTDEVRALMRLVAQASFIAARVVVEVLADEYGRRRAQLAELGGERR